MVVGAYEGEWGVTTEGYRVPFQGDTNVKLTTVMVVYQLWVDHLIVYFQRVNCMEYEMVEVKNFAYVHFNILQWPFTSQFLLKFNYF